MTQEPDPPDPITASRLAALARLRVLDTSEEVEFDDIVLLATTICHTPVGLVSLVTDDRQWFKARLGFPACQTDLQRSVCRYVLAEDEMLVIPDLRLDPRTATNPLVTGEPFIRFYAGAVLRDGAGVPIGSLCVIDTEARPEGLVSAQRAALTALAHHVTMLLEARLTLIELGLRKNAELSATRSELEAERRTGRLREQFVAVLGHDLRNPLAAIDAGLRLVERDPASPRSESVLGLMKQSVARMAELIDDTLDFARARLGRGLEVQATHGSDLRPVLEQVVAEVRSVHPECRFDVQIELSGPVACDPDRIGQMVSNLLSNAAVHGDRSEPIVLTARTTPTMLVLSVANGGLPIPVAILDRLFEPFSPSGFPERQGLGLGLYIAAEIARAHQGSLNVTSTTEQTRFVFQMPLVVPEEPRP